MTNREFDRFVRVSAQKEVFMLTKRTDDRLKRALDALALNVRIRRLTARTAALALLIVLLLTAVALAAVNAPGILDVLRSWNEDDSDVFRSLKEQTAQPQHQVYELPDATITVTEAIFEGNELYVTGLVEPKQGVVIMSENYLPTDPFGIDYHYGEKAPEGTPSYAEVAEKDGARLIQVHAQAHEENCGGLADYKQYADGTFSFISSSEDASAHIGDDGAITVTLTGAQWEMTAENAEIDDTCVRKKWTFGVPAIAKELRTPESTATPLPEALRERALAVIGDHESSEIYRAFHEAEPDAIVDLRQREYGDDGGELTLSRMLDGTLQWDVACVDGNDPLLGELLKRGMLADLSQSGVVSEAALRMYPRVREHIQSGGVVYAVPGWPGQKWYLSPRKEAAEKLGIEAGADPATFDGLLDFIERYLALPREARTGYVMYEPVYQRILTEQAVRMRVAECQYLNERVTLSTPEMLRLLARIEQLSARLLEAEGTPAGAGGTEVLLIDSFIPYRLFADSPLIAEVWSDLYVVNANSVRLGQAMRYAECAITGMKELRMWKIYPVQAEELKEKDREELQVYAERIAPYLFYAPPDPRYELCGEDGETRKSLENRYFSGKIGAEEYLRGLDGLLNQKAE